MFVFQIPSSRVTGSPLRSMFAVALLAHRSWSRAGAMVSCSQCRARPPHRKLTATTPITALKKTCCTPSAATVLWILPAHVAVLLVVLLRFYGRFQPQGAVTTDERGVTERCFFDRRRGSRAFLLQSQSWIQDNQW